MRQLFNKRWLPVLMGLAILVITLFQVYWLNETFDREKRTLEIRSNVTFRETVYKLQAARLKLDKMNTDSGHHHTEPNSLYHKNKPGKEFLAPGHKKRIPVLPRQKMIGLMNVLREKVRDSQSAFIFTEKIKDTTLVKGRGHNRLMQFLYDVDSLQDSVKLKDIETAFVSRMQQQNIDVPFTISKTKTNAADDPGFNEVIIGFSNPVLYKLELGDTSSYLMKRISVPILLSLFIVGFTILSFVLLFRNLLKQQRLANIKNEFISNITHELKTPIATVSVAIEALRSFNASMDTQRSKEYLDISANELLRLSLLVDKVLKLSMFEKKEIDLKYELLNMKDLVEEVTSSMRLQFEKNYADVQVCFEGDTTLEGDRLHLVSVIFNLLDNALKYSNEQPQIKIKAKGNSHKVTLYVTDDGIGIPQEYRDKIFEKFFRVPSGNLHNAKGYGLGLSYVAHVIKKHHGTIKVETSGNQGSKFVITLPKYKA
jgi:two-component system phosphate regulon sensor histidine kinase PhoR